MPLGTEVGLGPGKIVLDDYLAPPKGAHQLPTFLPMSIVAIQSPISATATLLQTNAQVNFSFKLSLKPNFKSVFTARAMLALQALY